MTTLLDIDSLDVFYGRAHAVRNVSLRIDSGDVLGIVGESGSGKSTLGLAILGLLPEYARVRGRVDFEGRDLSSLTGPEKRKLLGDRLSTIPQSSMSALDPVYRVGEQMVEAFMAHRDIPAAEARRLAVKWLADVGIPAPETRAQSYPHELSGGTRQRVTIATALALNPSLLIADEPTSALDVTIQAQIIRLLKALIREHAGAVILITHDLGVIAQLCNRVAVMYAGQIVEEAPVGELFSHARHPYTQALLASHPALGTRGERLRTIPGRVPDLADLPVGCSFQPRCRFAIETCMLAPPWAKLNEAHAARCVLPGGIDGAA